MTFYTQGDPRWAGERLGASYWTMGDSGCYVTSLCLILQLAGWDATPLDVLRRLMAVGGINSNGETMHWGVSLAYPQLRYDQNGQYAIIQLRSGSEYHYEARGGEGTVWDPYTGTHTAIPGFAPTGYVQRMACDAAPAPVTVVPVTSGTTYASFDTDLSYNDGNSYSAEVARIQSYLIDCRCMRREDLDWNGQIGAGSGWYGRKTSAAVDQFQKKNGIQADRDHFGWWYSRTRGAANLHLTV